MRKAFGGALCAALVGGLALAAIGWGATETYKGQFEPAGPRAEIKIKAKVRGGEVKAIKSMSYRWLPANCPESELPLISGGWTFGGGLTVNARRRFKVVGDDGKPNPSSLRFKGRFSRNLETVNGKFQTNSYFPPGPRPEETCISFPKRYGAKR